jgi:hypothetical protein
VSLCAPLCAVLILLIFRMSKKLKKNERQSIIMFDVLIIGGVSGISCALVLGSAKIKNFAAEKRLAFSPIKIIITTGSCFNNAYGIPAGAICWCKARTSQLYPHIAQIPKKKSCGLKGNLQTSR